MPFKTYPDWHTQFKTPDGSKAHIPFGPQNSAPNIRHRCETMQVILIKDSKYGTGLLDTHESL